MNNAVRDWQGRTIGFRCWMLAAIRVTLTNGTAVNE